MKRIYSEWRVASSLIVLLFTTSCFLLPTSYIHSQQLMERTLTFEESVGLAISNSQQLLSAAQDIQIARQRLKEARAIMYPQLEFNANYSRFNAESPLFLSPLLGNTILPQKTIGELDNIENYYTTKISLSQVLWSGTKMSSTKKFAETEFKTAESDYGAIKNKTVATAAKNFYKLLSMQKKLDICNASLEKLAGRKNDNTNFKNRFLADRNTEKIKSCGEKIKKELETARIDFLDSIGIELNTVFAIKGELEYKKVSADLNKCLAWAMEYRPELKKTQLQEQMDALSVNLSLSGRYPTVALGGNYQLEDKQWPFEKKSWNATVNLTLPIFDGFGQFARIRQKKYQYRKAQINRASISDTIKAEVRKSFIEYEYAIKKYEKKTKEAEMLADISELYKNISFSEYVEISEAVMQMQLEYIDAVTDVIIAKIDLETVVGKNLE